MRAKERERENRFLTNTTSQYIHPLSLKLPYILYILHK